MSKHYEFTGKVKDEQYYQIRAVVDIPVHLVKAGDIGGWMTKKSTLGENCWVAGDACLQDSILEGTVWVSGESLVRESTVRGKSEIKDNSFIFKSDVKNVEMSGDTVIRSSKVKAEDEANGVGGRLSLRGESSIISTEIYLEANHGKSSVALNSNARVSYSKVRGSQISFLEDTDIRQSSITGRDITMIDVNYFIMSSISGSQILICSLPKTYALHLEGDRIQLKYGSFENTTISSNHTIEGKNEKELVKVSDSKLDFFDTTIIGENELVRCNFTSSSGSSENIQMKGENKLNTVEINQGHIAILGRNVLDSNTTLEGDILINGENKLSSCTLNTTNTQIKGSCSLHAVKIIGDNNQILDFSVIEGKLANPAVLSGHVTLKDLASIKGLSRELKNILIEGDVELTI